MATNETSYAAHTRALLRLGLPLVGSSVAGFLIHMTDTVMLGWYDVTALAAAVIATSIWFIIFVVGAGFGNALLPLVAEAVEQGDMIRARRVTRMALWWSAIYGVLGVAAMWWSEALLLAIGQTEVIAAEGQKYLRIASWGLFPAMGANALRCYLSAQNLTAVQLWITLVALVMNALVNYMLIFGAWGAPELGIEGAAIASVFTVALQVIVLGLYAQWKLPEVALFQRIWRTDPDAFKEVFKLGLPIGLTSFAEGGLFAASSIMMGWIGELELAAHGAALQLTALMFMFHVGMSQAATVRAGNAFAHRDERQLRQISLTAIGIAIFFGILVVAIFVTIPGPLVSLFIDPDEPARDVVIQIGIGLMIVAALFQFVDSAQIIALSLLRGVQDTTVPMWLAMISYWVIGVPASYVLTFTWGLGPVGLWLGLSVGLGMAALLLGWRFWGHSVRIARAT